MLFPNLFPRPLPRARRKLSRPRLGFAPGLEALEDRWLPSTFTVLNLDDADPGASEEVHIRQPVPLALHAASEDAHVVAYDTELLLRPRANGAGGEAVGSRDHFCATASAASSWPSRMMAGLSFFTMMTKTVFSLMISGCFSQRL